MPAAHRNNKLTVSIVGAGRLGTALARALEAQRYHVEAVVARRLSHATRSATLLKRRTLALNEKQIKSLPTSSLILITTPDDAIATIAGKLAAIQSRPAAGRVVLHTSGALSSEVLSPLSDVGFHVGSLHPLVSVSDPISGVANLRGASYGIEGSPKALRVARAIVRDLGGTSFSVESRDKALYHAAAVMASGHTVALFDLAAKLFVACGLNEQAARRVLLPLLKSTIDNLGRSATPHALTGTFARGDFETVRRHLSALKLNHESVALDVYRLLGHKSLRLAVENGLSAAIAQRIDEILDS